MLRFIFLLWLVNFVSLKNATNANQNQTNKQLGNILYEKYTARARKGKLVLFTDLDHKVI